MTVLHRCASHKVRQLVIQDFGSVFFKNRGTKVLNKTEGTAETQIRSIIATTNGSYSNIL